MNTPFVDALAAALAHSLWQGAALAALAWVVLKGIGDRPRLRHGVACLALAALTLALPATAYLSLPGETTFFAARVAPPKLENLPVAVAPSTPGDVPASAESMPAAFVPPLMAAPTPMAEPGLTAGTWAVAAYLAGVALLAVWRLGGWLVLCRLVAGSRLAPDGVREVFERAKGRLPRSVRAGVRESSRVGVPAVVGWLRPVVLVPVGVLGGVSPAELELIFAHELAHVRRRDFLANLVQRAAETLLFYHPAAWWLGRTIRESREALCDDAAVRAGGDRLGYARALVALEEFRRSRPGAARPALAVAADGGSLASRVRRVLGLPPQRRGPGVPALALLAAGLLLATLALPVVGEDAPPVPVGERPRVVEVFPASDAANVPEATAIRIRFDRPMDPGSMRLEWAPQRGTGFRLDGTPGYDPARREFTLPVRLKPGKHEVVLNAVFPEGDEPKGFRAAGGKAAAPYRWSFAVPAPKPGEGVAPKLVSASPAADTELGLLTALELTFDRDMDPHGYGLASAPDPRHRDEEPALLGSPVYDAARRRFTLLLNLPATWNDELRLEGFRAADGTPLPATALPYRTRRRVAGPELDARIVAAGQSPALLDLVKRVRERRRALTGLETRATSVLIYGQAPDWHQSYEVTATRFLFGGPERFRGEIDAIMNIPFRVGGDGTTAWLRRKGEVFVHPQKDIAGKHRVFADAFAAGSGEADAAVVARMRLELLGEAEYRGRRCHRVRSWESAASPFGGAYPPREWLIDAQTLLPAQTRSPGKVSYGVDYAHSRIDAAIPDAEFAPDAGPGLVRKPAEPLEEGYDRRTLSVGDGSDGRMTVRWGAKGPKGTVSSGLN